MSNKDNFLKGAAILVIANFIVKIIGVVYKIPLTNIMGGEGMGYFSSAFDIYLIFFAISTAGLPVALSKMVSESKSLGRYSEINKIVKVTFSMFSLIGLFGSIIVFLFAEQFANFISNDLAKYSLMSLAPSLFFICLMSIFRGYFQGLQNMKPTAISQVFEALVKLFVGISLALYAASLTLGDEYISAFAIFGTTASTIISALILACFFWSKKNKQQIAEFKNLGGEESSYLTIAKKLFKIVIPIILGSLVVNLTGFLDLFLIISRLQDINYTQEQANFMYGSYKACAYTLFNLPPSIIATFNLTLIPVISSAFAKKDIEELNYTVSKSVKITTMFAFPCAVAFVIFANPILNMMFPGKLDEIAISTVLLQCLGLALPLVTLASMFTAILQAVGKERVPVYSILIASIIKIALNYILIGVDGINILGAPISTFICYLIILCINFRYIKKSTNITIDYKKSVSKSLIASIMMGVISYLFYIVVSIMTIKIAMLITILFAVVSYVVILCLIGGVTKDDVSGFPMSRKIQRFLK